MKLSRSARSRGRANERAAQQGKQIQQLQERIKTLSKAKPTIDKSGNGKGDKNGKGGKSGKGGGKTGSAGKTRVAENEWTAIKRAQAKSKIKPRCCDFFQSTIGCSKGSACSWNHKCCECGSDQHGYCSTHWDGN